MKFTTLLLVVFSVSLSAVAQLLLKGGVSHGRLQMDGALLPALWRVAQNPLVLGGFFLYGLGAVVWLYVLARVDVSVAYPFVGLGFILTTILGWMIYGESISVLKLAGCGLVVAGLFFIARSSQ